MQNNSRATLQWSSRQTAARAELEMKQRAAAIRAWEATLPPLNDLSQLDKRRRMVEEMEAKEWAFREGKIQKLQEARLGLPQKLLRQKNKAQEEVTNKRLNQIHSQLFEDTERKQLSISNDFTRSLRKLETKWRNVGETLGRANIDSEQGAPWAPRDKVTNEKRHSKELHRHFLDTYEDLLNVKPRLAASKGNKPRSEVIRDAIALPATSLPKVKKKYKVLREEVNEQVPDKTICRPVKEEEPVLLPVARRVEGPSEGDKEMELAVIKLQTLLRGRSLQYKMVKSKNEQLAQGLTTDHALQEEEQGPQRADGDPVTNLSQQRPEQTQDLPRSGIEDQSDGCRAGTPVGHPVQGADSSPGRTQDPNLTAIG